MLRISQSNMHRSANAHQLLAQFAAEVNADLVLISEQYRNKDPSSWYLDLSGTAAIWVRDDIRLRVLAEGRGDGFVWIRCLGITFFSVYLTPNESIPDFQRRLDALEDAVSMEELEEAVLTMKNRKAPGPDGIPAEVYKLVFRQWPELLLEAFNACLKEGIFPCRWKVARLALISKGKGDPELPSAYRPLCMLDTAGKVLEKLIRGRLAEAIRAAGD